MVKSRRTLVFSIVCLAAAFCIQASASWGAEVHRFDPLLSLTGNCEVSELDSVPDPGLCPIPPGIPGVDHPLKAFSRTSAIVTDDYGNIYVANQGSEASPDGRIDIFDASGHFLSEIEDPDVPQALAIDSEGNLYVSHYDPAGPEFGVVRYKPSLYLPATGEIEYANPPIGVVKAGTGTFHGLAINPSNGQLFVKFPDHVELLKSAAEGNGLIEEFGFSLVAGFGSEPVGIAVDPVLGRLYIAGLPDSSCTCVYALNLAAPHEVLFTIKGSAVPAGEFLNSLSLAVDEGTGHLFAFDAPAKNVYEFGQDGKYLDTVRYGIQYVPGSEIGIDNGEQSPNGALNPEGRYLFVPSDAGGKDGNTGHAYAFGPSAVCPPEVKSTTFDNVGESEAELHAEVEPCGLATHYRFEYITQQRYEEQGDSFAGSMLAGEGDIPAGKAPVSIAVAATGLQPGTDYRFRVSVSNEEGSGEGAAAFATYPAEAPPPSCGNAPLRLGFSALLPDCRAYELVTPAETNARPPRGAASATNLGTFFASPPASLDGGKVSFQIDGGTLPGVEATGSLAGDPYLAQRGAEGWSTSYVGPSGFEAPSSLPGSSSPDQGYSFWQTNSNEGSAEIEGTNTTYLRYPDGHSALVGRGTLADDPRAEGKLISENGSHVIFVTTSQLGSKAVRLTEDAPPSGTGAVYDRTADEVTHVVSLLPGNQTPAAGENASYEGASLDGRGVAFSIGPKLYLRLDNANTYEIGENIIFEGIAEGGSRLFYLQGGRLWRFDATTDQRLPFTSAGSAVPVNVSADGIAAYFVSTSVLTKSLNPNGAKPSAGKQNLYLSREGDISFVGTVALADVQGELVGVGLDLWAPHVVSYGETAEDPSRTTSDGGVLLFESRANLTGYDSEEHVEIYRYDHLAGSLSCLSCNPTLAPATGNASLQSIAGGISPPEPLGPFALVKNLSSRGGRAFFQSTEALVPADTDGLQDIYEWEAPGVGSCERPEGCVALISSGHSSRLDYLFAASNSGDDVFFRSGDVLLPADAEETASIYDARVNGGFPEAPAEECQGEGCRPDVTPAPAGSNPSTRSGGPSGNASASHCRKGKRKVKRHGKVRCVNKRHKRRHRHHRSSGINQKGGRG